MYIFFIAKSKRYHKVIVPRGRKVKASNLKKLPPRRACLDSINIKRTLRTHTCSRKFKRQLNLAKK